MDTPAKSKPMTQDEVHTLVELIQNQKAIFSKETKARANKEKDESWDYVCNYFNAVTGVIRTKDQLKAKWDNLKKAARKRSERIKLNQHKRGGGKPDFIPPDETLEKVAALLGSTCEGFTVAFGGDGAGEPVEIEVKTEYTESNNTSTDIFVDIIEDHERDTSVKDNTPKSNVLKRVNAMEDYGKITPVKGKKKKLTDKRAKRDLSMATYFEKKTEKLELETMKLKLEMKLLKKKLNIDNDENIDP